MRKQIKFYILRDWGPSGSALAMSVRPSWATRPRCPATTTPPSLAGTATIRLQERYDCSPATVTYGPSRGQSLSATARLETPSRADSTPALTPQGLDPASTIPDAIIVNIKVERLTNPIESSLCIGRSCTKTYHNMDEILVMSRRTSFAQKTITQMRLMKLAMRSDATKLHRRGACSIQSKITSCFSITNF